MPVVFVGEIIRSWHCGFNDTITNIVSVCNKPLRQPNMSGFNYSSVTLKKPKYFFGEHVFLHLPKCKKK